MCPQRCCAISGRGKHYEQHGICVHRSRDAGKRKAEGDPAHLLPFPTCTESDRLRIPSGAAGGGCAPTEKADNVQAENQQTPQPPVEERPVETPQIKEEEPILKITVGEYEWTATFADNCAAEEFQQLLAQGAISVEMEDYGGFEKVGALGTTLTRDDQQITTEPGDIILYQGNQITIYYGTNTWSFTKLAHIDDPTDLQEKLGEGTVEAVFSLE